MHFHTIYGFPRHGLQWTEDWHEATDAAWLAVKDILTENWQQDRARILADDERYGHVKRAYLRAGTLCLTGVLGSDDYFDIPALDDERDAMVYGVVECGDVHLQAVSRPCWDSSSSLP